MIKKRHIPLLIATLLINIELFATPDILVKYKNDDSKKALSQQTHDDRLSALQTISKKSFKRQNLFSNHIYAYRSETALSPAELNTLLNTLNAQNNVEYAELNNKLYPSLLPNDTFYSLQWTLSNTTGGINVEKAWDITTGSNIVIAVLDTGSLLHTDISGRYVAGYDFVSDTGSDLNGNLIDNDGTPGRDNDPTDPGDAVGAGDCEAGSPAEFSSWHGLAVSSIIAANTDNANGMAGINHAASIMHARVLARCGGSYADIADAIRWSAGISDINLPTPPATAAKVINLSLGGAVTDCPSTLQDAINDAFNAGSLIVVSAGNEASDASGFALSNCENTLSVAASTIDGNLASYSNFGEIIDITAPAGENTITSPGTLVLGNSGLSSATTETLYNLVGTSFAAPHVSGVASLMYAVRPAISPTRASNILRLTARAFPSLSTCSSGQCGNGLLDAETAVRFAQSDDLFGSSVDTIGFTQETLCATEDQGSISLHLQRIGSGLGDISINYQTIAGTATANSDYASSNHIVIWEDGDSANKEISIPIIDDTQQEAAETFNVAINDISAGGIIGNNNVIITIQSDDNGIALCNNILHPGGKLRLITASQTVSESSGTVTINVAREEHSTGEATVQYRTLAGAASENQDFTAAAGTLTWPDGDTSNKTITVSITNDTDAEANENFSVELFNNSASTLLSGNTISTIVIESDEKVSGSGAQYWLIMLLTLISRARKTPFFNKA